MKKRLFAVLASLCMVVSMVPTMAFAQDSGTTIGVSDLCEHHTEHTSDCGYTEGTEGSPCTHEHDEDCCQLVTECVHEHSPECCPAQSVSENTATPSQPEEAKPTACTHVCTEESGCITEVLNCKHEHKVNGGEADREGGLGRDEACGYVPATAGTPCTFVCEVCSAQDSGDTAAPSDAQPEECTCETLCTGDNINRDCPVCSAEGAELDKVCVGAAPMLPVTALAVDAPENLYVGDQVCGKDYWTTNPDTGLLTQYTGSGGDWNVHYDPNSATLTLKDATIKTTDTYSQGAVIYAHSADDSAVSLTINLEGTNKIECDTASYGIYVNAEMSGERYGTNASLTITGTGSLAVSGSTHGIWVKSGLGNASLTINNASVNANTTSTSTASAGVFVSSSIKVNDSPNLSLAVNGGSLTASGGTSSDGILFNVGSSQATGATTSLTVTDNAIVDAKNGGISAKQISSPINTNISALGSNGGIVFNGNEGTVYGNVTLQEDLEIGKDETLTIGKDASLTVPEETTLTNDGTITVENGGKLKGTINGNQPPKITTPPVDQTVTEGSPAVFSVTASAGEGETYQWQQKTTESDSSWTDIRGAATASYTAEATTTSMNGYQYRCVVTADGVSVISAPATLTVNEPVTYAITVHGSAGGTATADKTAAAEGETVTLTATPASGYHFDGWSVVSGTVTIQNNQFIMPAENVEIRAVFDRNSSSGGSGGSRYRDREYEFWMDVKEQIRDADPGDTIKVNARSYDRMPWSVMEALREAEDVTLRITWVGGEDIIIPSAAALNKDNGRIYYPLSYLEGLDFSEPAEQTGAGQTGSTVEVEAPASNPAGWQPTAPTEGQTQEQPEPDEPVSQPESEPASEPATEPETQPETEPDEETMAQPESGGLPLALILGGGAAVIAAGLGFWLWKRRSQE